MTSVKYLVINTIYKKECSYLNNKKYSKTAITLFFLNSVINAVLWTIIGFVGFKGILWKGMPKRTFVHVGSQWQRIGSSS